MPWCWRGIRRRQRYRHGRPAARFPWPGHVSLSLELYSGEVGSSKRSNGNVSFESEFAEANHPTPIATAELVLKPTSGRDSGGSTHQRAGGELS